MAVTSLAATDGDPAAEGHPRGAGAARRRRGAHASLRERVLRVRARGVERRRSEERAREERGPEAASGTVGEDAHVPGLVALVHGRGGTSLTRTITSAGVSLGATRTPISTRPGSCPHAYARHALDLEDRLLDASRAPRPLGTLTFAHFASGVVA